MKKLDPKTFLTHKEVTKELLKDPKFKKHWEETAFEREIFFAIVHARTRMGLTQKALAKKIGITQSALARLESSRSNPTLEILKKVTQGLGLKIMIK